MQPLPPDLVRAGRRYLDTSCMSLIASAIYDAERSVSDIRRSVESGTLPDVYHANRLATAAVDILRQVATMRGVDEMAKLTIVGDDNG